MPVGALNRLDLDHIGTERTEVARQVRARPECAQVEYLQAREGQCRIDSRRSPGRVARSLVPAGAGNRAQIAGAGDGEADRRLR